MNNFVLKDKNSQQMKKTLRTRGSMEFTADLYSEKSKKQEKELHPQDSDLNYCPLSKDNIDELEILRLNSEYIQLGLRMQQIQQRLKYLHGK